MFRGMRERRGEQSLVHRYKMREKLIAFGDDYYIEDEEGQKVFFVDGKMLRVRNTLNFDDMQRHELLHIQERFLRVRDTMNIEHDGRVVAAVHSALISPLRDRYKIDIPGAPDLVAQGNFLHHEYDIKQDGQKVAEVSKKWFRIRDTYGVEIEPDQNDILILAITACIDQMSEPG
jgi:uncharacterized protein YxjI